MIYKTNIRSTESWRGQSRNLQVKERHGGEALGFLFALCIQTLYWICVSNLETPTDIDQVSHPNACALSNKSFRGTAEQKENC